MAMRGKSSRAIMLLIALLACGSAWARGGGHGGGFGGGHFAGGLGGGHWGGSRFGGARAGASFHGGGRHAGRYYGGWNHYGYPGFGFHAGSSLLWPSYYYWPYYSYDPYYPPSGMAVRSLPLVYIEQGSGSGIPPFEGEGWGYCGNPEGYYPYVKECPGGWQNTAPQPAGHQPGYWYYCKDPAGYYPYVRECSAEWQTVVP